MTKTLFISIFFSFLLPAGLFVSALAFFVTFWVDRYSLFRRWKQPSVPMDGALAETARFQIAIILVVHCLLTQTILMKWPFDGLCIVDGGNEFTSITIEDVKEEGLLYAACSEQTENTYSKVFSYDFTPEWMTEDQLLLVRIYTLVNILIVTVFGISFFGKGAKHSVYKFFFSDYDNKAKASTKEYSFIEGITSYIPSITHPALPLPLLCCDTSLFDTAHCNFSAPKGVFQALDLTVCKSLSNVPTDRVLQAFSKCTQYKSSALQSADLKRAEEDGKESEAAQQEVTRNKKELQRMRSRSGSASIDDGSEWREQFTAYGKISHTKFHQPKNNDGMLPSPIKGGGKGGGKKGSKSPSLSSRSISNVT
jgi:hypothetical protein